MRFGNHCLHPGKTLGQYGICSDNTLHEMFGLLGAGRNSNKKHCIRRMTSDTQSFEIGCVRWGFLNNEFFAMNAYTLQHQSFIIAACEQYADFDFDAPVASSVYSSRNRALLNAVIRRYIDNPTVFDSSCCATASDSASRSFKRPRTSTTSSSTPYTTATPASSISSDHDCLLDENIEMYPDAMDPVEMGAEPEHGVASSLPTFFSAAASSTSTSECDNFFMRGVFTGSSISWIGFR